MIVSTYHYLISIKLLSFAVYDLMSFIPIVGGFFSFAFIKITLQQN